ncbi:MAG: hypothetical protein HON90_01560, partial [Halobacteriovoraceae bacterium]|nr:hypothetical protein [Halobacteriovoraceae bacterium]
MMNLFYSALSTLIISSNSFAFPSLESDLANQFARYESTKQYLQEQILIKKKHVSSIEIDNIIGNGLTPENQRNLYKKHNEIILKAKKKAQKNSLINFDNLRKIPHKIQQLCKQFPKGGNLHVHPNGAITHETVKRLLRLKDFSFQSYQDSRFSFKGNKSYNNMSQNDQSIAQAQFCLPRDVVTFSEFAQIFPITKKLVDGGTFSPMAYEAYKSYLLDAKKQGIRYVEFIKGFPLDKKSLSRLDQMAISLEKETGVIPRWQISYYRGGVNSSLAKKIIKSFTQNKSTAIVGINIVGDETYTPAMEHTQEFYVAISNAKKRFKNDSFGLTMHAGEMGQIKNVRDAVLLGSERIGHGVSLINDPLTLEYVRKQKLPV